MSRSFLSLNARHDCMKFTVPLFFLNFCLSFFPDLNLIWRQYVWWKCVQFDLGPFKEQLRTYLGFRVFSCSDNWGRAPISGQMANMLRLCSDLSFSHKILGVLPYEKIGAHRIKASRFSSRIFSNFVLKGLAPISIFPH